MNTLLLILSAVGTSHAQTFTEPTFVAPSIPETRGVYQLSSKAAGCGLATAKTPLARCEIKTDAGAGRMNSLVLSGTLPEIAYQHGKLLAPEIETGSLVEALENINALKKKFEKRPVILEAVNTLVGCYIDRVKTSLDTEFQQATHSLAQGYMVGMRERGKTPKFGVSDLETATYSIELGNIFGTLFENIKHEPVKTVARVLKECGKPTLRSAVREAMKQALEEMAQSSESHRLLKNDFACTGAILPASLSADGNLYHARNLEQTAMIESWNRNPMTFLIAEKGHYKYAAFGTAGLIFPGGISGYNEKGIAVSTHQMEGTTYASGMPAGTAAMGPYIQQRILREAATVADAVRIAKSLKAFSAWTILVSDAKTQESASIEITSEGVNVSRHRKDQAMGQSNYFFLAKNQELQFHENYNAYLETVARVNVVEKALNRGKSGINDILSLLASHLDWYEGERSFGRSVSRVMNIMSTVVSPAQNKVWVTMSDRFPSSQGYYLEYAVDFKNMTLTPGQAIRTRDYELSPNWEKSFSEFQLAYRASHSGDTKGALAHLREADRLANIDGIADPTYRYLIGRFLLAEGQLSDAASYLEGLLSQKQKLHPLKVANIESLLLYIFQQNGVCHKDKAACKKYADEAAGIYQYALKGSKTSAYFPLAPGGKVAVKEDLEKKLKFLAKILLKKKVKLPGIDMRSAD